MFQFYPQNGICHDDDRPAEDVGQREDVNLFQTLVQCGSALFTLAASTNRRSTHFRFRFFRRRRRQRTRRDAQTRSAPSRSLKKNFRLVNLYSIHSFQIKNQMDNKNKIQTYKNKSEIVIKYEIQLHLSSIEFIQ